ncbi:MAG TPA: ankyrin repeat domain-containing protein, partial [Gammaproteobacteria bacterium]|nr:ankyrin repeat domain-containing protein [Gammaproteobacteria bacterium]
MLTHLEFPPVISKEHYEEITPLCAAAEDDNLAIVKELLTQKANIEGNDKNNTPLIIALREDHINIAKYLIEEKADCSHPMVLGYAANLDADLVQTILDKKVDVDTITEDEGITALMVAAYNGPIENVKKFLALGADRTLAMDSGGKTALHLAAENGRLDVVEMLLVDNPVFDAVSNEGSALSIAFKKNHPKVVELLLNHGANIHVKIDDKNLLMYAIYRNFPECLEVLLKHYVNLNIPIEKNNDLLSYAAQQNFSECVEILLKHQFTFTTLDPYRLLDEAYHEGYKDTFEALLLHDEEKIKNYLDIRKKTPLKKVDFSNIKKDSEYFRLFQHENKNSAIRILQRQWRKKHLGKYKVSDQKTFPSKLSLYAIQEPVGFKAEEHANHIKEGNWLLLDFNDPEFSRNIYKALRQTRITMNEMAT